MNFYVYFIKTHTSLIYSLKLTTVNNLLSSKAEITSTEIFPSLYLQRLNLGYSSNLTIPLFSS